MPIELKMLAWSIALGLAHVLLGAALTTRQRGLKWNVGARDAVLPPLEGVAARVDRGLRNFLETFPFFAAAVLAVCGGRPIPSHPRLGDFAVGPAAAALGLAVTSRREAGSSRGRPTQRV